MVGLTGATPVRGVGLAILMHEGLTAWMQAVRPCISATPPVARLATHAVTPVDSSAADLMRRLSHADMIPLAQVAEAARLIVSLVLSARPVSRHPSDMSGAIP
jgi:hypothetical protein